MTAETLQVADPEVIVRAMLTHDRAIDDFLAACRARDWSESSIRNYAATLYRFLDRLPVDQDVSKTTVEDLRRYQAARQRQVSRNTLSGEETHLASYFAWLTKNRLIARDPVKFLDRTRRIPADDLDVVTIESINVRKLLLAAKPGAELNAIAILAYLGPRRHAVSQLKLDDYDRERSLMRFREKGSKTIWKPVPDELASILRASISRGDLEPPPVDYLVPPQGFLKRPEERDDRVIWRIVREVAENAGVKTHVHALRAAFAVFYLERNPDDVVGLKDLLGHKNLETTMRYLRKRNRQAGMERVRDLSWGVSTSDNDSPVENGLVEPEAPNESVTHPASGGGRIRTSGGSPRRSSKSVEEHSASSPPKRELEIVVMSAEETRSAESLARLTTRGLSPETCLRLVGLTEGEGCFYITKMNKSNWRCGFVIKMRADDRPLLDELCAATGVGSVRQEATPSRHHPCVRWEVNRKEDLDLVADIFRAYPLRSKKARDAAIWMEALDEWALIYRNERADWSRIAQLAGELREVRKFTMTREDLALLDEESNPSFPSKSHGNRLGFPSEDPDRD